MTEPTDRAALRDRIAKALAGTELKPPFPHCLAMADAVLAVLPEPTDRADDRVAVLAEVADWLKAWRPEFFERWAITEQERYEGGVDDAAAELRRLAAEAPTTTKPETATLAAALDGLHTLIATSSRDWGEYRVDAWLWAVLVGWDCEERHEHDGLCDQGAAMAEMALQHGWDHDTVAKARRYRAAVRALTELADGVRQDGAQS